MRGDAGLLGRGLLSGAGGSRLPRFIMRCSPLPLDTLPTALPAYHEVPAARQQHMPCRPHPCLLPALRTTCLLKVLVLPIPCHVRVAC